MKTVLWIDDSAEERTKGKALLHEIGGIEPLVASCSHEAKQMLSNSHVDAVVTDILHRGPDGSVSDDNGYRFFDDYTRRYFPDMLVVFHTKNSPQVRMDGHCKYLCKEQM